MIRAFALLPLCLAGAGCAGLEPHLIHASVQKPSQIAVFFAVDTRSGDPVGGLTARDFKIYEDGKLVSQFESKQTILNPEVAVINYTLLLLDMSGSVVKSGQLSALEEAAHRFIERVGHFPHQQIAVYAFDGRPDIVPLRGFARGGGRVPLGGFVSQDPSTNLNGAVVKAIHVLDHQLAQAPVPIRFGSLVVFTDGTDHAHRVSEDALAHALDAAQFEIYVIGVGAEIDESELNRIGRNGTALSRHPAEVGAQFDQMASRIENYSKRYYLLSYCSPARAGHHEVTIEPHTHDGESGQLTYEFNANGFGPSCDPNRPPNFDIHRVGRR